MIRIAVADDHPVPRAGIVQGTSQDPSITLVGEASTGPEVWELLAANEIDVLLLDLDMPDFQFRDEIPLMRKRYPKVKILIVTAYDQECLVRLLVEAGVDGYLLKDEDLEKYIEAIHDVANNRRFFSKRIVSAALNGGAGLPDLTPREREVLELVGRGQTSEQVSRILSITERTVNFHVASALRKLDVDSRTAAATKAQDLQIISIWRRQ